MVADAVLKNPDGEALICGDRRMTWREVAQQSALIAAGMQRLGLQTGDHVALLLGNRIEFVLAMLGAAHLGLVLLAGIYLPPPLVAWFQHVASLLR